MKVYPSDLNAEDIVEDKMVVLQHYDSFGSWRRQKPKVQRTTKTKSLITSRVQHKLSGCYLIILKVLCCFTWKITDVSTTSVQNVSGENVIHVR